MKFYLTILLLLLPAFIFAANNDFVADGDITVSEVAGDITADMIIFDGSTCETWTFDGGTFTVTNPGSAFKVGSSDSAVKSIQISQSGSTLICTENTTPGTSYATLPTAAGVYTVAPSATTDCTSLCATLDNTATYNSYPTCGAASCNTGYRLSGSGSDATCVVLAGGGAPGTVGMLTPMFPITTVTEPEISETPEADELPELPEVAEPPSVVQPVPPIFNTFLYKGLFHDDVKTLQRLLNFNSDTELTESGPGSQGNETTYFGVLTEKAVQKFQKKYNVVNEGGLGYGYVGPKTRAKLQEVFGAAEELQEDKQQIDLIKDQIEQLQLKLSQLLQGLAEILQEQIKGLSQ